MNYSLNIGEWNSVFAVPSSVVDKYLKLAGANSLKLLLYLLRHGGKEFSTDKLRSELGFTEAGELEDAALFWIQRGVIRYSAAEDPSFSAAPEALSDPLHPVRSVLPLEWSEEPNAQTEYVQQTIDDIPAQKHDEKPVRISPARVSSGEIASRMKSSKEVSMLFAETEKLYGRPLRQRENQTVIALVDHYGLSVGVALMLLTYCFKINKTSPNYIETSAANWSAEGIDSIDKADAKIRSIEKNSQAESRIRKEFGIDTEFTPKQRSFLQTWLEDWHFSEEMVKLAISKTINNTGKFAASYTNKILESWKRDGITLPEQTESSKAKEKTENSGTSYNMDNIMSKIISSYNN